MGKKKPIRHMGMTMTDEEHRQWHRTHKGKGLTSEEHEKLMDHLGISPDADRKWHKANAVPPVEPVEPPPKGDSVNCFAIGGGFLDYCVRRGWLIRQRQGRGVKYYVTEVGRKALAEHGITKY